MLILDRTQTEALLDLDDLRRAVAAAMRDLSEGRASMPPRVAAAVDPVDGMLLAMPAYLPTIEGLATKLVSLFPRNTEQPTHQAVVVAFDAATGAPAALMDGTSITAARTAAGSALSVELLARPDASCLTILGTGVQARAHAAAVVRVRDITDIRVAGRSRDRAAVAADHITATTGVPAAAVDDYAAACADADIVCATTHAAEPVVVRSMLPPGVHVTSVGYNTAGREVDSQTVADSLLVVESRQSVLAPPPSGSNDIATPIEEGLIDAGHIHAELGELAAGTKPGRTSAEQLTLYKSVGVAVQDVAAAALVLQRAREENAGVQIDL